MLNWSKTPPLHHFYLSTDLAFLMSFNESFQPFKLIKNIFIKSKSQLRRQFKNFYSEMTDSDWFKLVSWLATFRHNDIFKSSGVTRLHWHFFSRLPRAIGCAVSCWLLQNGHWATVWIPTYCYRQYLKTHFRIISIPIFIVPIIIRSQNFRQTPEVCEKDTVGDRPNYFVLLLF